MQLEFSRIQLSQIIFGSICILSTMCSFYSSTHPHYQQNRCELVISFDSSSSLIMQVPRRKNYVGPAWPLVFKYPRVQKSAVTLSILEVYINILTDVSFTPNTAILLGLLVHTLFIVKLHVAVQLSNTWMNPSIFDLDWSIPILVLVVAFPIIYS